MKRTFLYIFCIAMVLPFLACHKENKAPAIKTIDTLKIYGVRSGYYKTDMPLSATTAETWFSDWGNLQYTIITPSNDPIKSYKMVRYGDEYLYSDYNHEGIKRHVAYLDYLKVESPSRAELDERRTSILPTQIVMDRACKAFLVEGDGIPYIICFWKGIMMLDMTTDQEVISEVVDIRECSVPNNIFDLPKDFHFTVEMPDSVATSPNEMMAPPVE